MKCILQQPHQPKPHHSEDATKAKKQANKECTDYILRMQRNKQAKQANTIAERQTLLGRKSKRSSHYEFREMRNSATGTIHLRAAKAKAQLSSERRAKRRAEQSDEQSSTQSPTQLRAQEQSRSARGQAAKPWHLFNLRAVQCIKSAGHAAQSEVEADNSDTCVESSRLNKKATRL